MKDGLYNPQKLYTGSGKTVSTTAASAEVVSQEDGTSGTGSTKEDGDGEKTPEETPEQIQEAIAIAQKDMTPEQIIDDNKQREEAKLTPEEKTALDNKAKEAITAEQKLDEEREAKALAKVLEKLGVKTLDELENKIPKKELTPEEKIKAENDLKANVVQFAVKNNVLSMDDITNMENMKKMEPQELAYSAFAKEFKELNKGRVDEDNVKMPVTEAEIQDAFNEAFHIDSENAALKQSGEKQLEAYVKTLKGDLEEIYNQTVDDFKEFEDRKNFFPTFKTFLQETIAAIPAELTFGEGDNKITVATEKMDKKAVEKLFSTQLSYDAFYAAKGDQKTRDSLKDAINNTLISHNIKSIVDTAYDAGINIGKKQGSDVGAKVPFDDKKASATNVNNNDKPKLTQEKYRESLRGSYGNVRNR